MAGLELLLVSWLFDFAGNVPGWTNPVFVLRLAILTAVLTAAIFVLVIWPTRDELIGRWDASDRDGRLIRALGINLALFAVLVVATVLLTRAGAAAPAQSPPWHLFWAYCIPLFATALSLTLIYAPLPFWLALLRDHKLALLTAVTAATLVQLAGIEAQQGWEAMAGATLTLSYQLLALIEPTAAVAYDSQRLSAGRFWVTIDASCSGYEGIALVAMFVSIYMVVFRHTLRFPAVLMLLPLGMIAVWLLNAVRLALLVVIGAHISPDIALKGFHSQAGWISFLVVTIAIVATAHRIPLFNRTAAPLTAMSAADRTAMALLAPFMALMAGHILVQAWAPHGEWLIAAKLMLTLAALWLFRDVYRNLAYTLCPIALAAGIIVGVLWVATQPPAEKAGELAAFLASQPAHLAALWLAMRVMLGVIVVPVAEELAFRGFLYPLIASGAPVALGPVALSFAAIAVSSLLFGIMHERWMAGALAGVVFALVMIRSGRLSDAIIAHIAANAVVVGWAVLMRDWALI